MSDGKKDSELNRADAEALARSLDADAGAVEEVLDLGPSEVLAALARLDTEAAHAYRAAAAAIGSPAIARRLEYFAEDHVRHVEEVQRIVAALGETSLPRMIDADAMLLPALIRVAAPLGPETVLATLFNAEQLTNLSYEDALAFEWDDEAEQALSRSRADEQRHFDWLAAALRDIDVATGEGRGDGEHAGEPN